MGFKVPTKQFRLVFDENSDLAGLEVYVKSGTVDVFLQMSKLKEVDANNLASAETMESVQNMLKMFASVLVSWNAETEDGTPIPVTYESLCEQDLTEFVMPIIAAWLDAVTGASRPLPSPSLNIDKEFETEIPMQIS